MIVSRIVYLRHNHRQTHRMVYLVPNTINLHYPIWRWFFIEEHLPTEIPKAWKYFQNLIRKRAWDPIGGGDCNITLKTCLNFLVRWPVIRRTLYLRVQTWSRTVLVRLVISRSKSSITFCDAKCSLCLRTCSRAMIPRIIIPTRP